MRQEAAYVFRSLVRDRRFAAAVVVVLALGIGADLAVFALVNAILIRPLPYPNPDRLVRLWEANPSEGIAQSAVSGGTFKDWQRELRSFEAVEAFAPRPRDTIVQIGRDPEIARDSGATSGFMRLLGVSPMLGPATHVRISYAYWKRRFGSDPAAIGRKIVFEGFAQHPATIDGVMPPVSTCPLVPTCGGRSSLATIAPTAGRT